MGKIVVNIKDKSKEQIIISLLKELPFIEIKELKKESRARKTSDFRKLFGIWEGRKISLRDLREKSWQREGHHDFV
jgi:hypothetical protein